MPKVREKEYHHRPPPDYDPSKQEISLFVHYGGSISKGPIIEYLGGSLHVFDYVEIEYVNFGCIQSLCGHIGIYGSVRLYSKSENGLLKINNEKMLTDLCLESLKGPREFHLYVDLEIECMGSTSISHKVVENTQLESDNSESDDSADSLFEVSDYEAGEDANDEETFKDLIEKNEEWTGFNNIEENTVPNEEITENFGEEDIMLSEDELRSECESDNEDGVNINLSSRMPESDFYIGQVFSTRAEIKEQIDSYAVKCRRTIRVTKNDLLRVHGKCGSKGCEWRVHAVKMKGEASFKVREHCSIHTCFESNDVKNVRSRWIAKQFVGMWKSDANRSVKGFRIDVVDKIKCNVSKDQAYRAKSIALSMLKGNPDKEFQHLWDYVNEIQRSNPGSTIVMGANNIDETVKFDRIYVCLEALKQGLLLACRPLLGLDGCHLKGPHKGVLLTAVGVDPNNNIYPVAYAIVDKENTETWVWFLTLVKLDLNIRNDFEWTIISDKQKGLINAVDEVFPVAAHRFCVRHMQKNFKNAGFRGMAFKMAMWKAARATTTAEFSRRMKVLHDLDPAAAAWFNDKPPNQWSRSHFSTYGRSDMQLNNGCETFNACILEGRALPMLSMLEWIMEYLMKRQRINRDLCKTWNGKFCPRIQQIINKNSKKVLSCIPVKSSDVHYQVQCLDGSQYSVDLKEGTCGCRKWDLTGIPCKHVLSALNKQGLDIDNYVHACYTIEAYKKTYSTIIMPINGRDEWPKSDLVPPLPPNYGRGVGRPTKTRRREPDEIITKQKRKSKGRPTNPFKLPRAQTTIKCGKCGISGHNARGCKNKNKTAADKVNIEEELAAAEVIFGTPNVESVTTLQQVRNNKARASTSMDVTDLDVGESQVLNPIQEAEQVQICAYLDKQPTRQPPSMFQQFKQGGLRIIEPAPFEGINGLTKADDVTHPIMKDGRKYVKLSNLAEIMKKMKGKGKLPEKKKGKKKSGFV